MVRKAALILGMLASSSGTYAQSTNCYPIGNTVQCDTRQSGGGIDWGAAGRGFDGNQVMDAYRQGVEMRRRREEAEAAERQRIAIANQEYLRRRVGELVAGGDCKNARYMALHNGDFSLAGEVDKVCIPKE